MKKDGKGGTRSTHKGDEECLQIFNLKIHKGKTTLEDATKTDLQEIV
jgi:hypothetical protein